MKISIGENYILDIDIPGRPCYIIAIGSNNQICVLYNRTVIVTEGSAEDPMKNIVKIDFDRCKECGYCIRFCPKGVLSKGTKVNKKSYYPPVVGEGCIGCGTCGRVCPDSAIAVYRED